MGPGSVSAGLQLLVDPQRFRIASPDNAADAAWVLSSFDPHSPLLRSVAAGSSAGAAAAGAAAALDAAQPLSARFAGALAALDALGGGSPSPCPPTACAPALPSSACGTVDLAQAAGTSISLSGFYAVANFSQTLELSASSGSAVVLVYDVAAGAPVAASPSQMHVQAGRSYAAVTVWAGATPNATLASSLLVNTTGLAFPAQLARANSTEPAPFVSPPAPPAAATTGCGGPYYSLNTM